MMGTPSSRWPVSPIASGTEDASTNSMYAMPFDRLEFLSEIILTSLTYGDKRDCLRDVSCLKSVRTLPQENQLTFPTAEKKSSRSRARILAASCMQKTVRASLSSGVRLSIGCLEKGEKERCYIMLGVPLEAALKKAQK